MKSKKTPPRGYMTYEDKGVGKTPTERSITPSRKDSRRSPQLQRVDVGVGKTPTPARTSNDLQHVITEPNFTNHAQVQTSTI